MYSFLRGDRLRYVSPRYFRYIAHTIYLTPLIMGLASAFLFAVVPQMQEIYLGIIEGPDVLRGLAGLAAISLFSALLYAWNHTVVSGRIDAIYPDHADIYFDRRLIGVRDLKTAFASSLPFLGLLLGLAQVYRHAGQAARMVDVAGLPGEGALRTLPKLPQAIIIAMVLTVAAYGVLVLLLHLLRNRAHWQRPILYICYALTVMLVAVPAFASNTTLLASRLAGPLASTAFVLIEGAVFMRFFFWLLQRAIWLFLALPTAVLMSLDWLPAARRQSLAALIPLAGVVVIAANAILGGDDGRKTSSNPSQIAAAGELPRKFKDWLSERKHGQGRYPVFIVAAQGGGIYAASSTAAFLATMQDHCPAFAKHIFAMSAVSGGSVGVSLFDAALAEKLDREQPGKPLATDEPGCDNDFAKPGELAERLRTVTQADHMSPVLAYLLPDLIRGLFGWDAPRGDVCRENASRAWLSRDQILEKSFIYSFAGSRDSADSSGLTVCPEQADNNLLMRPFSGVWSEKREVPALLLNATWVETGFRVAFAPFPLLPIGGGTLYSFQDLKRDYNVLSADPSLMEAAVVSARFPVIMPPWVFNLGEGLRLTFVDGGYADSSGAATALQLYNELKSAGGGEIDLYLIALTDKLEAFTDKIEPARVAPVQSWLYDFFSPVNTLLSMRGLQSRKAVTEASTKLKADGNKMIVIQLDQNAFPLPLGWKLSTLSSDIIRLTLGGPSSCSKNVEQDDLAAAIGNSCAIEKVRSLLAKTH